MILVVLVVAIAIAIAATAFTLAKRRKKELIQPQIYEPSAMPSDQLTKTNQKSRGYGAQLSKTRLIAQAIFFLVFLTIIGYFIIGTVNSAIAMEQQLGNDVSFYTFMETIIIAALALGYVASLAQSIRTYRRQQPKMLIPQQIKPNETKSPMYKMAAESSSQTAAEQPKVVFCPNCGKQLPMSKNFCPFCGFDIKPEASESKTKS